MTSASKKNASAAIVTIAAVALVLAFVVDALTPQTLIVTILFDVPLLLAALAGDRRVTMWFLVAALLLNIPAAYIDAAHDGFHWNVVALETRLSSMLSIVVVGMLVMAVQARNERNRLASELAARNESLVERQAVIQELVDALGHDLRTPLWALSMTLQQAAEGAFGALPPQYVRVLDDSRASVDDLHRLAETLLLVARFEAAGSHRAAGPVVLKDAVRQLVSELRAVAQSRGIALEMTADGNPVVYGSRGDLRRAVANLIANAIRHTPSGGTIDVGVSVRGGDAAVVVADDGVGIARASESALFSRYARGTTGASGSGLGLYIVKRVAEETGGRVRYEPRDPRGSIFTLTLPLRAR